MTEDDSEQPAETAGGEDPETGETAGNEGSERHDGRAAETIGDESGLGSTMRSLVPSVIRGSYRWKFVISVLAILVVLSGVGAIGYVNAQNTVETDAEQQLTATVDMHADSINEWTISMESHTRSLSSAPALSGTDTETAESHIIEEQAKLPVDVRAIHVVDTNYDRVLTSTNGEVSGRSLSSIDEPWTGIEPGVDLTAANDVWYSPAAYQSGTLDDRVIAFASPVEGDEARIAVVVGTIDYRVDGLRQLHEDQETMILNTEGDTVLASNDLSGDPDEEIVESLGTVREGTAFERDGNLVIGYSAMADNDWVAITTVPTDQAFAASSAVGQSLLSVIGAGLLTLLVGGVFLARQTVTPLETLRDRAKRMEQGDLDIDLSTNRIDEVGRLYESFDEMSTALETRITEAKAAQAEAEAAQAEAEEAKTEAEAAQAEAEAERERMAEVTAELQRAADQYSRTMREAANGDLTVRADVDTDNEQMQEIGTEFNAMLDELEATVDEVKQFATDVAAASQQVSASSKEVQSASEQVAESVQEISDASERQSEQLQTVDAELSDLSASTEEIASTASEVETVAERTVDSSREGREAATVAIEEMTEVETEAERAVETIQSLETEVEQITELVDAISDVADQTNLLALNASIEATRAGEGGEAGGFDMVAQEIKELSADAKDAAAEIEDRIDDIREKTDESVDVVEHTSEKVEQGTEAVQPAVDALAEIAELAEDTNNGVTEISAATDAQAASTEEVVTAVDEVASSSEESAAEASNVSAAAEEQTASLSEVTRSVDTLADQAAELSQTLDRFETAVSQEGSDGSAEADQSPVSPV
ncbi:methyl-accepting chemotaxis protein [Natrialba asiatica]|uniref:Methyl-accepting chemotaxis sensory transducer n=1 Tax=Natrialba asiatica (strain ATCC 700177 / DSM 12278 / JCM 9576 / FERM P-10747 / NBRC 102637 / 172P1) TaxID=29540 RepID=M0AMV7_NATA1|nr:methyl-accepting chemotaxis protein [Natrialba asiatica]ELY99262.1 methyl-accepting chemotaxis sensory transducer [Natrialba asiatica DSM 12278]